MVNEKALKPWLRPAPRPYILQNASIVDVAHGSIRANVDVTIIRGKIHSITPSSFPSPPRTGYIQIDCTSLYLCPGLIDCHVHLVATPGFDNLAAAFGNPESVSLLRQPYVCAQMLHRGFTTVRDCGGAHTAIKEAIEDGVFPGPRLFIAGHALSQSGGHADFRNKHDLSACCGGAHAGLGRVCNGVAQCMQAVREEIRCGSDFIKIMGSGGVSSPTDKISHLQFTPKEIRAMVNCAKNAGTYVTAHAYTPAAIRHCIENGVQGIEHGNFLDKETAVLMAEHEAFLTPTLVTYDQMAAPAWEGFLPRSEQSKNTEVLEAGLEALKIASEAGVKMCFGTDLLGPLGAAQTHEFALRSKVLTPLEVLRSATLNAASMMDQTNSLGQVEVGFEADILFLASNPLDNVKILDAPETYVKGVMKEGRVYKSRWSGLAEDANMPIKIGASL
ncbi:amidohydrolase [Pseudovirgaria hyperparasitica]|uniref:Amidohydrolase n=1 Tax=Pseudovirgaria hyperparasitica TaxID=470096 RepID=A0A6A6W810_9PEZI|nr:amidohydrolase [Pseudovirgaria hyperparasitica]KAF2758090.1 amidohydrolase [Pseudovirgaria hyperparasitica]